MGLLAIPNRPFSGKPVMIIAGKIPPDGDYRKPLADDEMELLQKVVPDLSIRVVDSKPELSDPRLEFFLREYYNMGDSRISNLTWSNIFDACKNYVTARKKKKDQQSKNDNDCEIDSKTREQAWRDIAPEYIPNSDAVKMGVDKISLSTLSKHLRKPSNSPRKDSKEERNSARTEVRTPMIKPRMTAGSPQNKQLVETVKN